MIQQCLIIVTGSTVSPNCKGERWRETRTAAGEFCLKRFRKLELSALQLSSAMKAMSNEKQRRKRRQQRKQQGGAYAQKQAAKRVADDPERAKVLAELVTEIINRYLRLRAAAFREDGDAVEAVAATARILDEIEALRKDSKVWGLLSNDLREFLLDVARRPLVAKNAKWVQRGVLIPDKGDQPIDSTTIVVYRRTITFRNAAHFREMIGKYVEEYPADAPHAIFLLSLVGTPLEQMKHIIRNAFEHVGHPGLSEKLFDNIDEAELTRIKLEISEEEELELEYDGLTGKDGSHRDEEDEDSADRRVANFLNATNLKREVFTIDPLTRSGCDPLSIRRDPEIGEAEEIVIQMACGVSLNSARGGWIPLYAAPEELLRMLQEIIKKAGGFDLGDERDEGLEELGARLIYDELDRLMRLGHERICEEALAGVIKYLCKTGRRLCGYFLIIDLMKDLPNEEFVGRAGMPFTDATGRGLRLKQSLTQQVHGVPVQANIADEQVSQLFGTHLNLWHLRPKPKSESMSIISHYLYVARFLHNLDGGPLVITSRSKIDAALVDREIGMHIFEDPGNPASRDAFLDGDSPDDLTEVCSENHMKHLSDLANPDRGFKHKTFTDLLGAASIRQFGRDPSQIAYHIILRDEGHIKYEPIHEKLRCRIQVICIAKVAVLVAVMARQIKAGNGCPAEAGPKREWMEARGQELDDLFEEAEKKLTALKKQLRRREAVIGHLRAVGGEARAKAKAEAGVPSEDESEEYDSEDENESTDSERSDDGEKGVAGTSSAGLREKGPYFQFVGGKKSDERKAQCEAHIVYLRARRHLAMRADLSIWPMNMPVDAFREWYVKPGEGVQIEPAARARGSTEAHAEAQRANTANVNRFNTEAAAKRRVVVDEATGETQRMRDEREGRGKKLVGFAAELTDWATLRDRAGKERNRTFRWGRCRHCEEIVVGKDQNSLHDCLKAPAGRLDKKGQLTLNKEDCPVMYRIQQPVDIFDKPELLALVEREKPLHEVLRKANISSSLIAEHLADVLTLEQRAKVPEGRLVYHSKASKHESTEAADKRKFCAKVFAFIAAFRDLSTAGPAFNALHDWQPKHIEDVWLENATAELIQYKKKSFHRVRCSCGYFGVQPSEKGKAKTPWPHGCPEKKKGKIVAERIRDFYGFPIPHGQRIIHALFIEGDCTDFNM